MHRTNADFAGAQRSTGKRSRIACPRLQMPGPAAMTPAPATPSARQVPALGDRLMVGLQTLTLPV